MTEKRLIVRDGDYAWIDTVTDTVIEVEDAFDLVNNLADENEQLKERNEHLEKQLKCITQSLQSELNYHGFMSSLR